MEMPSITSLDAVRLKRQREIDLDRTRNGQIGIAVSFYIPSPSMNYIRDSMEVLKVQYGSVEIEQVVHKGENRWTRKEEVELSGRELHFAAMDAVYVAIGENEVAQDFKIACDAALDELYRANPHLCMGGSSHGYHLS